MDHYSGRRIAAFALAPAVLSRRGPSPIRRNGQLHASQGDGASVNTGASGALERGTGRADKARLA